LTYFTKMAAASREAPERDGALLHRFLMANAGDLGWRTAEMEVLMALCLAGTGGADVESLVVQLKLDPDVVDRAVRLLRLHALVTPPRVEPSVFRASPDGARAVRHFLETGNAQVAVRWLARQMTVDRERATRRRPSAPSP
jgi:hypothetical protein